MKFTKKQELETLEYAKEIGISPDIFVFNRAYKEKSIRHTFKRVLFDLTAGSSKTLIEVKGKNYSLFLEYISEFNEYHRMKISPGKNVVKETHDLRLTDSEERWNVVFSYVKHWLFFLKIELDAIDGIKRLAYSPSFTQTEDHSEFNQVFEENEKVFIKSGIEKIKNEVVVVFDLEDYKLNLILNKLNELQTKVDELNKFDFKSAMYGVFINITSSVLYDNAGKFWEIVRESFPKLIK